MITSEMKYTSMELLTNACLLMSGKIGVLSQPFGLRDYASEPTNDEIRSNPISYYESRDIEGIKENLIALLMRSEQSTRVDANSCIDMLMTFCTTSAIIPTWRNPFRTWSERKYLQAQRVLSLTSPSLFARVVGVDREVAVSLSHALSL